MQNAGDLARTKGTEHLFEKTNKRDTPIFEDKEMFRVTIPLLRDEKLDEKDLINLANGTLNDTLNLLKINPGIKQKDMALKLKVMVF